MSAGKQLLVVTDLDGSLLDDAYSWTAARPALKRLKEMGIPLILNSSKTISEMRDLAEALSLTGEPIVAENGGLLAVHETSGFMDKSQLLNRFGEYCIQISGPKLHCFWSNDVLKILNFLFSCICYTAHYNI